MEVEEISRRWRRRSVLFPIVGREELAAMVSPSADVETEELSSSAASVEENLPIEQEAEFSTPMECALESDSGVGDTLPEENPSATVGSSSNNNIFLVSFCTNCLHPTFLNNNNSARHGGNASNSYSNNSNSNSNISSSGKSRGSSRNSSSSRRREPAATTTTCALPVVKEEQEEPDWDDVHQQGEPLHMRPYQRRYDYRPLEYRVLQLDSDENERLTAEEEEIGRELEYKREAMSGDEEEKRGKLGEGAPD